MPTTKDAIEEALEERFGETLAVPENSGDLEPLTKILRRRVCRSYSDRPVEPGLTKLLCAAALSAAAQSSFVSAGSTGRSL